MGGIKGGFAYKELGAGPRFKEKQDEQKSEKCT